MSNATEVERRGRWLTKMLRKLAAWEEGKHVSFKGAPSSPPHRHHVPLTREPIAHDKRTRARQPARIG